MRVLYLFSRLCFLGLTVTKLSNLKTVRVFLAHPVYIYIYTAAAAAAAAAATAAAAAGDSVRCIRSFDSGRQSKRWLRAKSVVLSTVAMHMSFLIAISCICVPCCAAYNNDRHQPGNPRHSVAVVSASESVQGSNHATDGSVFVIYI